MSAKKPVYLTERHWQLADGLISAAENVIKDAARYESKAAAVTALVWTLGEIAEIRAAIGRAIKTAEKVAP